ncbi:MAG: head maturation protease, ClpP-related [Bacilli bacterium]
MKKWFEIINKADKAEIWIYEQIGEDFWTGGGVTAKNFQKELAGIKASQIDLHINSPGGEVFDGITIYNLIKQHPANVTAYIDGLAASIASVIALAGDTVIMAENALFMIHNPWGFAMGDATEMRKTADLLDKIGGSLVTAYASKSGKPDDEISAIMNAETWMTAQEAKDAGFIDEISEQMDLAACAKFVPAMQKAKFKNIPENLSGSKQTPTAREAEKALRDVGFTQAQAKVVLAEGFKGFQRDVDPQPEKAPEPEPRDVEPPAWNDRAAALLAKAEKELLK